MLACILELSNPPYSRCLQIAKSRIHFESLVVGIQTSYWLRSHSSQQGMPFSKIVHFREKKRLLGRLGTRVQRANLVWAPKIAIHRQADYPVVNNLRSWEWNGPNKKNTLQKELMLRRIPSLLLEVIAGILPEFVLMKMEPFARTGKSVTRFLSKSPRKLCNSISSERNLLKYEAPRKGIFVCRREREMM